MVIILVWGTFACPALFAQEDYIQYEFDNPDKVFQTTTSESVIGSGADPHALYQVLRSGQFVIVNDKPNNSDIPWLTTEGILVNAPQEQVYEVIQDYDHYGEFMPQVGSAANTRVTDEVDRIDYELAIQILFVRVKIPYAVYHWNQPTHRVDWVMAGGEFTSNYGAYEVIPVPDQPERSMLFYTSFSQPRNKVVVSLFSQVPNLDMMINLSTGILVVEAMKNKAEQEYAKKGGKTAPPKKEKMLEMIREYPETLAILAERGKLIVLEDNQPRYYSGGIIVNKPRAEVYKAITDFEGITSISKNNEMLVLEKTETAARVKVHTVINLVIDFDTKYIVNYKLEPPQRVSYKQEPGGDIEGVAGSWELIELESDKTLVFYRNTADLHSHGIMMRQLLKLQPSFGYAIQASQTQWVISDTKLWAEASPKQRKKLAAQVAAQE